MKKILLSLLFIISLTGCSTNIDELIGNESSIISETNEITLKVKADTLTKDGATFVLENSREELITYNDAYTIEIKKDNKWHELNIIIEFTDSTYELEPKDTDEITIDWSESYLTLPKGEYRVIKEVTIPDTLELFYVDAPFTIE